MAFTINPKTIIVSINTANTNLDGTGTIALAFVAQSSTDGSVLNAIRIQAIGDVPVGMIRLFRRSAALGTWRLIKEIPVPETTRTGQYTAFAETLITDLFLGSNNEVGVSTETANTFKITSFGYDITGNI
jgi:hypothetical protein